MVHIPGRCPSRESHPGRERGGHTRFLSAFRAMEMRPASQEGHTPTGKRPGLIGMPGAMALKNLVWPPRSLPGCDSLDGHLPGI